MTIENYHAHIYYDDANRHIAEALREEIEQRFVMRMGRWREKPVGPHPQAMFQVAFENDVFAKIVLVSAHHQSDEYLWLNNVDAHRSHV